MKVRRSYLLAGVVFLALMAFGSSQYALRGVQAQDDLLSLAKVGSKEAASAIKSGTGKITEHGWVRTKKGGETEAETVYTVIFKGSRFKLSSVQTTLSNIPGEGEDASLLIPAGTVTRFEASYDGSIITAYYPDEQAANILERKDKQHLGDADYWRTVSPRTCGFNEIFPAEGAAAARQEIINGVKQIVVDWHDIKSIKNGEQKMDTKWTGYYDPAQGWAPVRTRVTASDGVIFKVPVVTDETNLETRDYGAGIWGPARFTLTSYRVNKTNALQKTLTQEITYAPDFQFNIEVSDNDLTLKLPSGTKVLDTLQDATYTVP